MKIRLQRCGLVLIVATITSTAQANIVCTAFVDAKSGKILKQEGSCDQRVSAQSTFKIAISLMGYDSGFLVDGHTPALPFHEGYPDWIPEWKTTTDPTTWIKYSVVWYSQQVTQHLGEQRFQQYVTAFNYGNKDVSGDPGKHNGLTNAWLNSSLRSSPLEQVSFLRKLVTRKLAVSPKATDMTSRITYFTTLENGWEVHGKTGTGNPFMADGTIDPNQQIGWFVGWTTKGDRTLVFARLIQEERKETTRAGLTARADFMEQLPSLLDSLIRKVNQ